MSSDEQTIRELHTAWIEAVNAGDLTRLVSLMADDAVFLNPGQAPIGRHEFPGVFSKAHQEFWVHCHSELQEIAVAGSIAYTRCRDLLSVKPRAGGDATKLAGHRLTIYRQRPDGGWLLARDAHTLAPVAS